MVPETADCQRAESVLGCKCRRSLAHRRKNILRSAHGIALVKNLKQPHRFAFYSAHFQKRRSNAIGRQSPFGLLRFGLLRLYISIVSDFFV